MRLPLASFTVALALTMGVGCDEGKPPPRHPQPGFGPYPMGVGPYPGAPPVPGGPAAPGPSMNAQAAALVEQGKAAFLAGELQYASTYFTQATQADPRAHEAYYSLGVVQQRLEQPAAAAASFQRAFGIKADYVAAIAAYGLLLAGTGKLSEADRFLTDQRGRLAKSAEVAGALAEVKSLAKDTASAQSIAQEALKLDPDYRPAMMTIARDHYRNRRLDLALYALQAVLDGIDADNPARDKNNAEGHLLRGIIWSEMGLRGPALEAFREAVRIRPDMVTARLRLATFLLEAGDAAEALPILQRTVKYDGESLAAHLLLGDAYRLTGQYPAAKAELEWVVNRDANLPQAHYNLGLLYLFAPSIPGMQPLDQVNTAMASLKTYQDLRRKTDPDATELLSRANLKKAEIEAKQAAASGAPAMVPPGAPVPGAPVPGAPMPGAPMPGAPVPGQPGATPAPPPQ